MNVSIPRDAPVLTVSAAAQLAGMHAQTLRQYDRLGLVIPSRTRGGGRRYSLADVERLQEVQRLSQEEGVNLAGILRIMQIERENERLSKQNKILQERVEELLIRAETGRRVFAASPQGNLVVLPRGKRLQTERTTRSLVIWKPQ